MFGSGNELLRSMQKRVRNLQASIDCLLTKAVLHRLFIGLSPTFKVVMASSCPCSNETGFYVALGQGEHHEAFQRPRKDAFESPKRPDVKDVVQVSCSSSSQLLFVRIVEVSFIAENNAIKKKSRKIAWNSVGDDEKMQSLRY